LTSPHQVEIKPIMSGLIPGTVPLPGMGPAASQDGAAGGYSEAAMIKFVCNHSFDGISDAMC